MLLPINLWTAGFDWQMWLGPVPDRPYAKPTLKEGVEYRVTVSSSLKKEEVWAKPDMR
jgi:hypothetical protein